MSYHRIGHFPQPCRCPLYFSFVRKRRVPLVLNRFIPFTRAISFAKRSHVHGHRARVSWGAGGGKLPD